MRQVSPAADVGEVTYNTYQQLGVDGLRGLANFNVDTGVGAVHCLLCWIEIKLTN